MSNEKNETMLVNDASHGRAEHSFLSLFLSRYDQPHIRQRNLFFRTFVYPFS